MKGLPNAPPPSASKWSSTAVGKDLVCSEPGSASTLGLHCQFAVALLGFGLPVWMALFSKIRQAILIILLVRDPQQDTPRDPHPHEGRCDQERQCAIPCASVRCPQGNARSCSGSTKFLQQFTTRNTMSSPCCRCCECSHWRHTPQLHITRGGCADPSEG